MFRKCIVLLGIAFVSVLAIVFSSASISHTNDASTSKSNLEEYTTKLGKLDHKLRMETANIFYEPNLPVGEFVLEIYYPGKLSKLELNIEKVKSDYMFHIKDDANKINVEIYGDVIQWYRDIGYSGGEYYLGYIRDNYLYGEFYPDYQDSTLPGKWRITLCEDNKTVTRKEIPICPLGRRYYFENMGIQRFRIGKDGKPEIIEAEEDLQKIN